MQPSTENRSPLRTNRCVTRETFVIALREMQSAVFSPTGKVGSDDGVTGGYANKFAALDVAGKESCTRGRDTT